MTPCSPAQIGRFQVQAHLGAGAFGRVYRAHDPQLDRAIALKVPHPGTLDNAQAVERFLREAKAAARLDHPHIVPVYAAGRDGAHYYIASAFIEGHSLAHAIEKGSLNFRRAARIVHDLAEALAYAHSLGIVHRDVKPANVMLDASDTAHLMDFGLAHRREEAAKLTQEGAILGTPAYMAPEQAQGQSGEPLPASDQYSLGVVLYELLCGQTPFSGPPPILIFNAIHQPPPPPHTVNPKVPRDLETICLKALAKRPAERYASCQVLADDLQRWSAGEPIAARPLSGVERLVRWCRRNPVLALASVMATLCLTAVAVTATVSAARVAARRQSAAEELRKAQEGQQAASAARQQAEEVQQDEIKGRDKAREQKNQTAAALEQAKKVKSDLEDKLQKLKDKTAESGRKQTELDRAKESAKQAGAKAKEALRLHQLGLKARCGSNVAVSPDGKWVALGSGPELLLWEITAGPTPVEKRLKSAATVRAVAFDPTGKFLAWVSADRTVHVCELPGLQVRPTYKGHRGDVHTLAFSPDGRLIASAGAKHPAESIGIHIWSPVTGTAQPDVPKHKGPIRSLAYSSDGRYLATGNEEGVVRVWDARAARDVKTKFGQRNGPVTGLAFRPDGQWLAALGREVCVWDVQTGELIKKLPGQYTLAFSPNGRFLATARKSEVVLYNVLTWEKLPALTGRHTADVTGVAFSPDGAQLVSVSIDDTVRLWDLATPE